MFCLFEDLCIEYMESCNRNIPPFTWIFFCKKPVNRNLEGKGLLWLRRLVALELDQYCMTGNKEGRMGLSNIRKGQYKNPSWKKPKKLETSKAAASKKKSASPGKFMHTMSTISKWHRYLAIRNPGPSTVCKILCGSETYGWHSPIKRASRASSH